MSELGKLRSGEKSLMTLDGGLDILRAFAKDCGIDETENVLESLERAANYYGAAQRVRDLHKPTTLDGAPAGWEICSTCYGDDGSPALHPCATIRALEGEL